MAGEARWSAVVMPCLNEQDYLLSACCSLGFCGGAEPPGDCYLILVDNGSTDSTLSVCHELRRKVGRQVVVTAEPVRGHVPARRRGNQVAERLARVDGVELDEAIIIQADADSQYSAGYVDSVRAELAADRAGVATLAQATTRLPANLKSTYPATFALIDSVDARFEEQYRLHERDVVVDDKACAYLLADYWRWGGHRREYFSDGSEVLAETTRLMIAASAHGAAKLDVCGAATVHSQRRLEQDALHLIATLGFPYVAARPPWGRVEPAVSLAELEGMAEPERCAHLAPAFRTRIFHFLALMVLLPRHLAAALGDRDDEPADDLRPVLDALPRRPAAAARMSPATFLHDVLELCWPRRQELVDAAGGLDLPGCG